MTNKEFEYNVNKLIYDSSAIEINQLIGVSKTATASIGLYLNVPITVKARKVSVLPEVDSKRQMLAHYVTAYLKHDDQSSIQFAFFYTDEADLPKLFKACEKHTYYFSYLYMREIFRLVRNHNTKAFYDMMKKRIVAHNIKVPPEYIYSYILLASDYSINGYLQELFKTSPLNSLSNKIFEYENIDLKYKGKPELDILLDILGNSKIELSKFKLDDGIEFITKGNTAHWVGFADYDLKDNDEIITILGESISNHLKTVTRGLGSAQIFESAIDAVKTKTGWFKKLTKTFEQTVHYATNKHICSWANFNTTYRHKFKAPKHIHKSDTLNIYLSVDHSGSMSDTELGKLLHLMTKHAKRISQLTVWVHDTEIIKEYVIKSEDISSDPAFLKAFKERIACGGTSFKSVFAKLDELRPDPTKCIYMAFSDFVADVPQCMVKYPWVKKIPTYWLCTINNPLPSSVGGTYISIE